MCGFKNNSTGWKSWTEINMGIAMVTAHGKTRSYLHQFKITESPVCPCANSNQTVEHIIYDCGKLNTKRRKLIADISKDHWPVGKNVLGNKYLKQITHFINSIDYGNT
jgi:hypothetical protein